MVPNHALYQTELCPDSSSRLPGNACLLYPLGEDLSIVFSKKLFDTDFQGDMAAESGRIASVLDKLAVFLCVDEQNLLSDPFVFLGQM